MYPGYKFEIAPIVAGAMGCFKMSSNLSKKWLDSIVQKSNC